VTPRLLPAGTGRPIGLESAPWALLGCAAIWLCVATPCALFALSGHASLGLVASDALPDIAGFAHETMALPPYDMAALVCEALLVSCAISLAQLLLSLAVDARLSFVVVAAQFAGSLFVMNAADSGQPHERCEGAWSSSSRTRSRSSGA